MIVTNNNEGLKKCYFMKKLLFLTSLATCFRDLVVSYNFFTQTTHLCLSSCFRAAMACVLVVLLSHPCSVAQL